MDSIPNYIFETRWLPLIEMIVLFGKLSSSDIQHLAFEAGNKYFRIIEEDWEAELRTASVFWPFKF